MQNENLSEQEIIDQLASHYEAIIKLVGEDPDREGLMKTPMRAAKAMYYVTRGYRQDVDKVVNDAIFTSGDDQLVVVRDIEFYSLCEHHLLPFFGHVSVGYVPNDKIIGLSKLARLVDMYARRLQVQERFGSELCKAIMEVLDSKGVIIECRADHLCMKMRGVEKQNATTVTIASEGILNDSQALRDQFFHMIRG